MSLPFPDCTGQGVRIAVVDSGVHPEHPHIDASRLEPGVAIAADGTIDDAPDAATDRLGHGTAVMAAIQEKAPGAICLPIRVFREELKTSAAALVAAIRWAIDQRADIVNLSLGTTNAAHRAAFQQAAEAALDAGVLIVAAYEANEVPCFPGALPQVLGVRLDWDCPRERYRMDAAGDPPLIAASGYPRPIPGVPPRRNLYGISFAVAQVSGFAALACERAGSRVPGRAAEIRRLLMREEARLFP